MRRFELSDSTSNKFWEVDVKGKTLNINFGKIGIKGQSKPKDFATPEKAKSEMEKLIKEKAGKGYVEVGGKAVKTAKLVAGKKTDVAGIGEELSEAAKNAKAKKILSMFSKGQWQMAHDVLEAAQKDDWLFEQLLNGCKIENGKPIPSNAINKLFKKAERNNPVLAMLNIIYCIPEKAKIQKLFNFEKLKKDLDFEGLKSLSDGAAKALSKYKGKLNLCRLESLPDSPGHIALAEKLASQVGGYLSFYNMTSLSDAAVKALSNYKGWLIFYNVTSLSDAAAAFLSKHDGELEINGLYILSDVGAESLSKHKGKLHINGLQGLSDAAATSFSKHKTELIFDLPILSDTAAMALSNYKGDLWLKGLTVLKDSAGHIALAKKLATQDGEYLFLDDLASITASAAMELSKHKGWLTLRGLKSLSDGVAEILSKHEGDLALSGLTSLSDTAAMALSKHEGGLNLDGLISLTDSPGHVALVEKLVSHRGTLELNGLISMSDGTAELLSKHKGGELRLGGLKTLSDIAAKALSKHKGWVHLINRLEDKVDKCKRQ
jgi:predicted DNA-binding WGR domain protein